AADDARQDLRSRQSMHGDVTDKLRVRRGLDVNAKHLPDEHLAPGRDALVFGEAVGRKSQHGPRRPRRLEIAIEARWPSGHRRRALVHCLAHKSPADPHSASEMKTVKTLWCGTRSPQKGSRRAAR